MGTEHGKFDVQGLVEHRIGTLLIGEYPFIFGLTYVLPLGYGLLSGIGTLVVVADNSSEQTVVTCGNPVMVIE